MKKCNMCGSQLQDSYNACPNCGNTNLTFEQQVQNMGQPMNGQQYGQYQQPMPGPIYNAPQVDQSKGNILWALLGFLIPLVGWILYLVWKNNKPGDAKMAGIGGLVGFCFNLVIQLL